MHWPDYAILAVIAISTLVGALRGFIKEVFSLVVWAAAFLVAAPVMRTGYSVSKAFAFGLLTLDLGLPPDPDSVSEGFKLLEETLSDPGIVEAGLDDRVTAVLRETSIAFDWFTDVEPEPRTNRDRLRPVTGRTMATPSGMPDLT